MLRALRVESARAEKSRNSSTATLDSNSLLTLLLGTGTSQGVPMIGCDCAVCHSSDPRDKRLRSSVYIETPETLSSSILERIFALQALRENIRARRCAWFSLIRTDHIMGFDGSAAGFSSRHSAVSMPVYARPKRMADLGVRVFLATASQRD